MPTLDDVYRKFGEAAEAAQLLETELGNLLLWARLVDEGLLENKNAARAASIFDTIERSTLGQLLQCLNNQTQSLDALHNVLSEALNERNRLFHSFYPEHNFRRNSDDGRALMLKDLEAIHNLLLDAYKALLALHGIDVDALDGVGLPTRHLPIRNQKRRQKPRTRSKRVQ
jgi:hypothetical protein